MVKQEPQDNLRRSYKPERCLYFGILRALCNVEMTGIQPAVYDAGLPVYHINRTIEELNHRSIEDESHIVYVNGAFRDTSHPIGRLMHDFWCTSADDMLNDVLAKEVRYMKESEEGRTSMCEMMEKMLEKANAAGKAEGIAEEKAEGKMIQLYELVHEGDLSLIKAAAKSGLTETEFKAGMEAYFAQLASA